MQMVTDSIQVHYFGVMYSELCESLVFHWNDACRGKLGVLQDRKWSIRKSASVDVIVVYKV